MSTAPKTILAIEPNPKAIVAAVTCQDLDHETTQQLKHELEAALAAKPGSALVLDLSRVEFVPSMALGVLVTIHKNLQQAGRKCLLVGVQSMVLESMQITGLNKYLDLCSSLAEGLKQL